VLRGVIFDIDGTLVASNEAHARSWVDTLKEAGYDVPFDVIWPMIGMGGDKVLPSAAGIEVGSEKGKALTKRRWEIFKRDYLPKLEPTRGARSLVSRIRDEGLKTIVATSAGGNELELLLEAADVADLMNITTSASDAAESKPDPDIVMAAIRKSKLDPGELLMVGDTPYDVQAAIGAHVNIIGLLSGGWTKEELSGAVAIYDDPADLLKWYDASPLVVEALAE
jgi:phosphoglycolate phosphatase-like HAD superfamily hydrolase